MAAHQRGAGAVNNPGASTAAPWAMSNTQAAPEMIKMVCQGSKRGRKGSAGRDAWREANTKIPAHSTPPAKEITASFGMIGARKGLVARHVRRETIFALSLAVSGFGPIKGPQHQFIERQAGRRKA